MVTADNNEAATMNVTRSGLQIHDGMHGKL